MAATNLRSPQTPPSQTLLPASFPTSTPAPPTSLSDPGSIWRLPQRSSTGGLGSGGKKGGSFPIVPDLGSEVVPPSPPSSISVTIGNRRFKFPGLEGLEPPRVCENVIG
ncbi:hypothetical protein U1Q18_012061 [Sarracenia purpurea var. burkii]